jgi:hypothetical protein
MSIDTAVLSLDNPLFRTYALAASLMLLKLMLQPWMTVARMLKVNAGFRSPEDVKKSPLNPEPEPKQRSGAMPPAASRPPPTQARVRQAVFRPRARIVARQLEDL